MAVTERLKRAQLAKLKQRYLDLIAEAGMEAAAKQEENRRQEKQLFTERMEQIRDLPQQLVAAGRSGGMGEEALRGVELAYRNGLAEIERARKQVQDAYNYEVQKQNRLMQLAVEEFLARVQSSGIKSGGSTGKSSSKKSSSKSSSYDMSWLYGGEEEEEEREPGELLYRRSDVAGETLDPRLMRSKETGSWYSLPRLNR